MVERVRELFGVGDVREVVIVVVGCCVVFAGRWFW